MNISYKKDELHYKFQDLDNFESYRRASETNIQQFLIKFDQCYHKLKRHQTTVSEDLVGFKLLKAGNLSKVQIPAAFEHEVKIKAESTFLKKESTSDED